MNCEELYDRLMQEARSCPFLGWLMPFRLKDEAQAMAASGVKSAEEYEVALNALRRRTEGEIQVQRAAAKRKATARVEALYHWLRRARPPGVAPAKWRGIAEKLAGQRLDSEIARQVALANLLEDGGGE